MADRFDDGSHVLMKHLVYFILTVAYVIGIVVAKGFWMTLFSLIPLIAWVECVTWILHGFPKV
jgi:hypothetical protein